MTHRGGDGDEPFLSTSSDARIQSDAVVVDDADDASLRNTSPFSSSHDSHGDAALIAAPAAAKVAMPRPLLYLTALAAVGGFMFGYDTGIISGALVLVADDFALSTVAQEAVVSITLLGAIVGSLLCVSVFAARGRRPLTIISAAVYACGAPLMAFAPSLPLLLAGRFVVGVGVGIASNVVPVYIAETTAARWRGRLVTVFTLFITGGQFIASIVAGVLTTAYGGGGNTDIANNVRDAAGNVNVDTDAARTHISSMAWRVMLGISGVPALLQLLGMWLWAPESPVWLFARSRSQRRRQSFSASSSSSSSLSTSSKATTLSARATATEAAAVAAAGQLYGSDAALLREYLAAACRGDTDSDGDSGGGGGGVGGSNSSIDDAAAATDLDDDRDDDLPSHFTLWQVLRHPHTRWLLLLGCTLQFLQQACAINTIMYYAATILKMAGFHDNRTAIWLAVAVAGVNFVFTIVGMVLVDYRPPSLASGRRRWYHCSGGRRPLLLTSLLCVCMALCGLGATFYVAEQRSPRVTHDVEVLLTYATTTTSAHAPHNTTTTVSTRPYDDGDCGVAHIKTCFDCTAVAACGYLAAADVTTDADVVAVAANDAVAAVSPSSSHAQGLCLKGKGRSHYTHEGNITFVAVDTDLDAGVRDVDVGARFGRWMYKSCPGGSSLMGYLLLLLMLLYLCAFAPGMGPMPWTINSELYPLPAKSVCVGVATMTNWTTNFVVSATFLTTSVALSKAGVFFLYGGIGVAGWLFLYAYLPETRSKDGDGELLRADVDGGGGDGVLSPSSSSSTAPIAVVNVVNVR